MGIRERKFDKNITDIVERWPPQGYVDLVREMATSMEAVRSDARSTKMEMKEGGDKENSGDVNEDMETLNVEFEQYCSCRHVDILMAQMTELDRLMTQFNTELREVKSIIDARIASIEAGFEK